MSEVALLDVNVLLAMFFADHVHYQVAHDWFADHYRQGWATCPLTENGFVRIASRLPAQEGIPRPAALVDHLRRSCSAKHHHAWTDVVSLRDASLFAPEFIRGHKQVADVYLLGLAKKMGGRLATFDRTIPLQAVKGATPDLLEIIALVE